MGLGAWFKRRVSDGQAQAERTIVDPNAAELDWIAKNLELARAFVAAFAGPSDSVSLESLDDAWASWLAQHDPTSEDPNPIINSVGIAFGHEFVKSLGMKWAIVTDKHGTEMAVYGRKGDALIFPANLVAKRYVNREGRFLVPLYAEMVSNLKAVMTG